ncbi:hypothetical protein [Hyphomonas oceanitis]|uniref:hypothetical protein n=1 Tax=Hyphomonas oceanitis TaxID=81033 RepID=UPI00300239D9
MELKWSHLAAFGNTPLAKAVVFLPLVAQFVQLSSGYLEPQWGLRNSLWLYWSLNILAAAQLLYFWRAPRSIKKYGDDYERFVEQALNTWNEKTFVVTATSYARSHFKHWGDGSLALAEQQKFDLQTYDRRVRQIIGTQDINSHQNKPYSALRRLHTEPFRLPFGHNFASGLQRVIETVRDRPIQETEQHDLNSLKSFLSHDSSGVEWRKDVLNWTYQSDQRSNPIAMWIAALLYITGSIYFVVNTWDNLSRIAFITMKSIAS